MRKYFEWRRKFIRNSFFSKEKHRAIYLRLTVSGVLIFTLFFAVWGFFLFKQLEFVTNQRALRRPAQFFSAIAILKIGAILSPDEFIHLLDERGYLPDTVIPSQEHRYFKSADQNVFVFFRTFFFPNNKTIAGLFQLSFAVNRLAKIENYTEYESLDELPLEPVPLGDLSKEGAQNRPWIPLNKIPPALKSAILTSEDKRFFQHPGLDYRSLARALIINLKRRGVYQGGSTLTQQLVKNAFLTQKRTLRRKITEALLALLMEARYDKNTILEIYLNQIYLGKNGTRGIYGVEDASLSYFGQHVSELSLGQSALIAGIIPAPNINSPRVSMETARQRRNLVLELMIKNNRISAEEGRATIEEPVVLTPPSSEGTGSYYLNRVKEMLEEELGELALDFLGYKVYTAMDIELQKAAEKALLSQPLEGALVAIDPKTGDVRALAGGRDYRESQFNRAILAHRQPGSAFKPILYTAALQAESITLSTILEDMPVEIAQPSGIWKPRNYDGRFAGTTTVRDALVFSVNIPSIHVLEKVGPERVIELAKLLGIRSELKAVPSLALGTSEVTPLELTGSYAAFANGGYSVKPLFVKYITDAQGSVVREYLPETSQVISPELSYLMTNLLEDAINRGTGKNVRQLGFTAPCAGKTGTSDSFIDAWFIGYTTDLLCGVWLGNDQPKSLEKAAAYLALPVWTEFMMAAQKREPSTEFEKNKNVIEAAIDPLNCLRARSGCPEKRKEIYLKGTEPKEYCRLHPGGISGFFRRFFSIFKK
ncbi:MAG: PBP1A family penicillin-binding protein [Elusimicrobiota bacterium]